MAPKKTVKKKSKSTPSTIDGIIPYPEGEPTFDNPAYRDSYYNLARSKTFMCSPSIDILTLERCGIKDKVLSLLSLGGLQVLVDTAHLLQYEIPTREFVATFEVYEDDDGGGWKFYLGGKFHVLSQREICDLFKFPLFGGINNEYTPEARDELWKEISGMDMFVPLMSPKQIHDGAWKYIHRLVSLCVFTRKDGGRLIQRHEMDVMVTMSKGLPVNWYYFLSSMFKVWGDMVEENLALGGGAFVSLIAQAVQVDLSTLDSGEYKLFDIKQLVAFKMWRTRPPGWIHDTSLTDRVEKLLEGRVARINKRKARTQADHDDATTSHHNPGAFPPVGSSFHQTQDERMDMVISRLSGLEVKVDNYIDESRNQYNNLLAAIQGMGSHYPSNAPSSSTNPYPSSAPYGDFYGSARPDDRYDDL